MSAADDGTEQREPGERGYLPNDHVRNSVGGDNSGLQIGTVNLNAHPHAALFLRRASEAELVEVRGQFVAPGGFLDAQRALRADGVVVLLRPGSGRTFTARRLLDDRGADAIVDLNPDRAMSEVAQDELHEGEGYVWDVRGPGDVAFTNREFRHLLATVRTARSWLVLLVDHRSQVPSAADGVVVELQAPDPVEVALAVVRQRCPETTEGPTQVLKSDLDFALNKGDPPEKAVRAAALAIEVSNGSLTAEDALTALTEDVGNAVGASFVEWSSIEYSMLAAVAVLENQPFDEVAAHALELDKLVRTAELPSDKKLRPRRVFAKPKHQLLKDIGAEIDERAHPLHPGLREQTVRFARQDWADAALCHLWREYHTVQPMLLDWMCAPELLERFGGSSVRALCTLITGVPAHEPLRPVDNLAAKWSLSHRELAAATVTSLVDVHRMEPLVKQILEDWIEGDSVRRKSTAALAYGLHYGRRNPAFALTQLARIGQSTHETVQAAVVRGVLSMLADEEDQEAVLDAIVAWTQAPSWIHRPSGLPPAGQALAMWAVGFLRDPNLCAVDPAALAAKYPDQITRLVDKILRDRRNGRIAIARLAILAEDAHHDSPLTRDESMIFARAELRRLVRLIAPGTSWDRRRVARRLAVRHPESRRQLRFVMRTVAKLERAERRKKRAVAVS